MKAYAFLFTGQGAQYAGMGEDLYEKYSIFKEVFDEASEHLRTNLNKICSDENELSKTQNAQPAIFAASYGIYKILSQYNINPHCAAGFSLGEITSFAASGILSFKETLDLIKMRGEVMQKACEHTPGAMYSIIGAEEETVKEICGEISKTKGYVIPANYNCPGQIAISGEETAAEEAAQILSKKNIRTVKLKVAGAFHSGLMRHRENEFTEFLKTLNYSKNNFDLYSNMTGKKFDFEGNIKTLMVDYIPKQMSNPVKFREELENIEKDGCDLFIETGAGKTLSGFVKRTCRNTKCLNIQNVQTLESAAETLK